MKIKNFVKYFKEVVLKYFRISVKYLNISFEVKYFIVRPYVYIGTEETQQIQSSKRSLPKSADHAASDQELAPESRLPTISSSIRYRLLRGDMDNLPVVQSRVVRIYVSSHFYGTCAV